MRSTWAQKTYDEIINASDIEEVDKIFNGIRYLTKSEIGAIIGELLGTFNSSMDEKIKLILKSKKYNENLDCMSEMNEPIIICLIKAFFNNIKNGNITNKKLLKSYLLSKDIKYDFNINDSQNNSFMHILMENCNLLNDNEFEEIVSLLPIHNINLLNKNNKNQNIIQLFNANNKVKTKNKKKKILDIINTCADKQCISLDVNCYKLCEETV